MSLPSNIRPLRSAPIARALRRPVRGRECGAAVLVAMLVVAMAAVAASSFLFRSQIEWRRVENLSRLDQARSVLRAAERWGAAVLQDDARQNNVDHPGEAWAAQLPPVEAEGFRVSGRVEDQDGRFNLNDLVTGGKVDTQQLTVFVRLLRTLRLPEDLAITVADWLDADDTPLEENSAESAYYGGLAPPYRAADHPLISLNELLRVKNFDRNILSVLRPFVAALPTKTPVNINTARPEVLVALVDGLDLAQAYALAAKRERSYYRNLQDFQQALPAGLDAPLNMVSVSSQYFLVQARIRHERLEIGSQALFRREGRSFPTLIWRAAL